MRLKRHLKIVNLPVTFLKEGNKVIAHTPVLDLSTCGNTLEQAKKRFAEALHIFIDELVKMGTLEDVLLDYGWKKASRPEPHWLPPVFIGREQESVEIPLAV